MIFFLFLHGTYPDERKQFGVVSHEVQDVLPEITSTDSDGFISVDYSKLTPLLINAIKEQQAMIESLKLDKASSVARISKLETDVQTLIQTSKEEAKK
ncbi:MAG: hypothetical protein HY841_05560 [Bacteroidetes bacterium]|nr:hypothetical protein [Bacteroidota bacterium]